jgi:hypothetical protein
MVNVFWAIGGCSSKTTFVLKAPIFEKGLMRFGRK